MSALVVVFCQLAIGAVAARVAVAWDESAREVVLGIVLFWPLLLAVAVVAAPLAGLWWAVGSVADRIAASQRERSRQLAVVDRWLESGE